MGARGGPSVREESAWSHVILDARAATAAKSKGDAGAGAARARAPVARESPVAGGLPGPGQWYFTSMTSRSGVGRDHSRGRRTKRRLTMAKGFGQNCVLEYFFAWEKPWGKAKAIDANILVFFVRR